MLSLLCRGGSLVDRQEAQEMAQEAIGLKAHAQDGFLQLFP